MKKNQALPEPIITPTTKGEAGTHDERLTCAEVVAKGLLDAATWEKVSAAALAIFRRGQEVAAKAGLILVDTKYELGRTPDGRVMLIDEVHTPDSSRFWKADTYRERFAGGRRAGKFRQGIRAPGLRRAGLPGRGRSARRCPTDLWIAASQRYISIYEMLTGKTFEPAAYPAEPRIMENLKKAEYSEPLPASSITYRRRRKESMAQNLPRCNGGAFRRWQKPWRTDWSSS